MTRRYQVTIVDRLEETTQVIECDGLNMNVDTEPASNAFWQVFWRVIGVIAGIAFGITLMALMVQNWEPLWMLLPLVAYAVVAVMAIVAPKGE